MPLERPKPVQPQYNTVWRPGDGEDRYYVPNFPPPKTDGFWNNKPKPNDIELKQPSSFTYWFNPNPPNSFYRT